MIDFGMYWPMVIAALSGASCAILGVFLLLRRMSMMGDALSHSVLPGIVLAYLLLQSRGTVPMLIGAVAAGLLTVLLTQFLNRRGKVEESASMGVVFTSLFALGVLMISRMEQNIDLDLDCVLFGNLEGTALQAMPRAFMVLSFVLVAVVLVVLIFFKELKLCTFDAGLARSLGIPANFFHYLIMGLLAMATVASFEAVGSVLVIAMLVVPAATARLLTDRLSVMLWLAVGFAVLAAALGYFGAYTVPVALGWGKGTFISGMMVVVSGLIFFATLLFAPQYGVVGKIRHIAKLRTRLLREDVLGILFRMEEKNEAPARDAVAKFLGASERDTEKTIASLAGSGLVLAEAGGLALSEAGRAEARQLIRNHRLWESYLHQHLDVPVDHLHSSAEALEHITDADLSSQLEREVKDLDADPHGKRIP